MSLHLYCMNPEYLAISRDKLHNILTHLHYQHMIHSTIKVVYHDNYHWIDHRRSIFCKHLFQINWNVIIINLNCIPVCNDELQEWSTQIWDLYHHDGIKVVSSINWGDLLSLYTTISLSTFVNIRLSLLL